MAREPSEGIRGALDGDEIRDVLRETFFNPEPVPTAHVDAVASPRRGRPKRADTAASKPRPEHYKVICISMYTDALARLDDVVKELKRRGYTKANRSAVLRVAVDQLDLDRVPRGI